MAADLGAALPPLGPVQREEEGEGTFAEIWEPPYDRRAIMLSVFNFFQTFGYYGFAAWVPTLLIAKGITITTSLLYSFVIAIANPVGPLLGTLIADRMERKWQVCAGAIGIGVFGMLFANAGVPWLLIVLGVLVTLCNNWMSFSFHSYQSELFPTRIRSRAVGFVYSWSRLSAALSGLVVAYLLNLGGVNAVFAFIAFAMVIVVVSIGAYRSAHTRSGAGGDLALMPTAVILWPQKAAGWQQHSGLSRRVTIDRPARQPTGDRHGAHAEGRGPDGPDRRHQHRRRLRPSR